MITNIRAATLADAVKQCQRFGGVFWRLGEEDIVYHINEEDGHIYDNTGRRMTLCVDFFKISCGWVYQKPQNSAFKEWNETQTNFASYRDGMVERKVRIAEREARKKGWNAALEEVMKMEIRSSGGVKMSPSKMIEPDQVKNLIEP
jgi:hypothetical protein